MIYFYFINKFPYKSTNSIPYFKINILNHYLILRSIYINISICITFYDTIFIFYNSKINKYKIFDILFLQLNY